MPPPLITRIRFFRDLLISVIHIWFGRLFPKLHVPATSLDAKTAIVTGGNSGIGFSIALSLAKSGATVCLACRNASKAEEAVSDLVNQVPSAKGRVKAMSLDTSSLASVRAFAQQWGREKIDLLIHNAGIGNVPSSSGEYTADGFPTLYATNFLGSFLLTQLLETCFVDDTRVILTSSTGQYGGKISSTFSLECVKDRIEPNFHAPAQVVKDGKISMGSAGYANTKAMQVAFANALQARFDRQARIAGKTIRRIAHAFSPGFTYTPIFGKVELKTVWEDPSYTILKATTMLATDVGQGAATGVWLATTQDSEVTGPGKGGAYWDRMARRLSKIDMLPRESIDRLWVRWEADAGVEWR